MRIRVEKITAKRAQEWLDRSFDLDQRRLRVRLVERLAHAIRDGQWQLTHQAIALDPGGRVLDGQHRLSAIVLAGQDDPDLEVECLVAWDSDPASFDVIDTGAARTVSDTLRIAGFTNTNILGASVRSYLGYRDIVGTTQGLDKRIRTLTTADVMEFLDDPKQRDHALGAVTTGSMVARAVGRYGLNTSLAASALVMLESPRTVALGPDAAAEFWARLSDGAMLASRSPILALRRWMIGDSGFARIHNSDKRHVAIAVTIKTVNDYLLGRERSVVSFRTGLEPMPSVLSRREVDKVLDDREAALRAREAAEEA